VESGALEIGIERFLERVERFLEPLLVGERNPLRDGHRLRHDTVARVTVEKRHESLVLLHGVLQLLPANGGGDGIAAQDEDKCIRSGNAGLYLL
jgi:hypothetical protein